MSLSGGEFPITATQLINEFLPAPINPARHAALATALGGDGSQLTSRRRTTCREDLKETSHAPQNSNAWYDSIQS